MVRIKNFLLIKVPFVPPSTNKQNFNKNNNQIEIEEINNNNENNENNDNNDNKNDNGDNKNNKTSVNLSFRSNLENKLLNKNIISDKELDFLVNKVIETRPDKVKLLYRLSDKKGFSAKKFHKLCDEKSNTLFICESDQGKRFGGINYLDWSKNSEDKLTDKNMLFSLSNLEIHPLLMNESGEYMNSRMTTGTITYDSKKGLIMGETDLVIGDDCSNEISCSSDLDLYELKGDEDSNTYLACLLYTSPSPRD